MRQLLGFVDGQTTYPSLIAKNPHIRELIASGHKLSSRQELDEYKSLVETISPLVSDARVLVETRFVHQVTLHGTGLRAAQLSVMQGMLSVASNPSTSDI